MSNSCPKCGKEFDTKRGLHIHQSQKHKDDKTKQEKTGSKDNKDKQKTLELGIKEVSLIFFILGAGIGFVAGAMTPIINAENKKQPASDNNQENNQLPIAEDNVDVSKINITGEPTLGSSEAKVTMVIYEDFECPFCQRFENNAFQKIEKNYVNSDKVRIIWKDFPLPAERRPYHKWAADAAETMECVYRQDETAFWNIKDLVFENQKSLNQDNAESTIISWAKNEGVSESNLNQCLSNEDPLNEVNQDKLEASNLDAKVNGQPFVGGTPSFVVYGDDQGTALSGALPYRVFERVIEKEIKDQR